MLVINGDSSIKVLLFFIILSLFIFTYFNCFIYYHLLFCLLFKHIFFIVWIRESFMTEKRGRIIFRVTTNIIFFKDNYIESDSQWNYLTSLHSLLNLIDCLLSFN